MIATRRSRRVCRWSSSVTVRWLALSPCPYRLARGSRVVELPAGAILVAPDRVPSVHLHRACYSICNGRVPTLLTCGIRVIISPSALSTRDALVGQRGVARRDSRSRDRQHSAEHGAGDCVGTARTRAAAVRECAGGACRADAARTAR